mgnify:CR=1 FL=1
MRLKAVVIILRKNRFFHTGDAIIYRKYGELPKLKGPKVEAVRKGEGYGVALLLEPSQVDIDLGVPTLFISADEIQAITEALDKSDELTEKLLNRGWAGKRPYLKIHHFM